MSIILMKDKTEHKIKRITGDRIQNVLQEIDQHIFVKIDELGITINSAEIKEVKNTTSNDYTSEPPELPITDEQRVIFDSFRG